MTFIDALAEVVKMYENGEALDYGTGYNHDMGRYIDIETDQGWSTVYMEFEYPEYSDIEGSDLCL